jgi:ATP phosphoribosyltransferase
VKAQLLTLAAPKGRILDESIELFGRAGIDLSAILAGGRKLVHELPAAGMRVLVLRSSDVPTFVEHGAADLGIAGSDVLLEQQHDLYEPLDLSIGRCRLAVAEPIDRPVDERRPLHLRYATKFTHLTAQYLAARGITAEVIKLYGSVELGPLTGLADRIVDLVQSGETLRENRLREVETIMEVSSRLVVNRAAMRLKQAAIDRVLAQLGRALTPAAQPARRRGARRTADGSS